MLDLGCGAALPGLYCFSKGAEGDKIGFDLNLSFSYISFMPIIHTRCCKTTVQDSKHFSFVNSLVQRLQRRGAETHNNAKHSAQRTQKSGQDKVHTYFLHRVERREAVLMQTISQVLRGGLGIF